MTKTFILDTNVLLSDPKCLNNFQDNNLIVPMLVLEELDKHKSRSDEIGRNCREVNRSLDDLFAGRDAVIGVKLPSGGILRILSSGPEYTMGLPPELKSTTSVDNMILGFVDGYRKNVDPNVILVSKDINVRIKCSALGISAQDYLSMKVADSTETLYTGVKVIITDLSVIEDFYAGICPEATIVTDKCVLPNEIVVLKNVDGEGNTNSSALARFQNGRLMPLKKIEKVFGLFPRNKEQKFSIDLLMDPDVKLVTLTGRAGCGKTLIAMAAGLEQLESIGDQQRYQKLIVSRPVQPVGRDIGFLPGTLEEKMEPWISPIRDSLEFLLGASRKNKNIRKKKTEEGATGFHDPYLELLQSRGLLEIEAISFIRGRSIPNAFIVIDEAQNLTLHELKTIITRAGEGTKIVLTGDIEQIDNVHVDTFTNGLTYAVEKFKEYDIAGHITLLKGERSDLATLASKIL